MGKTGRDWTQIYAIYGVDDWQTPLFLLIHAIAFSILSLIFLLYFDSVCYLFQHFLPSPGLARFVAGFSGSVTALSAVCLFFAAANFFYSTVSLHWDMSQRIVSSIPDWSSVKHALDLGCGRGILLNAVALQLKKSGSSGRVVGLNPTQNGTNQFPNPTRTLRTATLEGVQEYVTCRPGDPRTLPFSDNCFDVVVSAAFVHTVGKEFGPKSAAAAAERMRVLAEVSRVLKPGGVAVVWDIVYVPEYVQRLHEWKMEEIRVSERVTAMDIEIISKERIKPSSPTPNHLRNFKLCLLDQLIPAPYAPIVLFYPNSDSASHAEVLKRLRLLKESLSEILTRFYPLSGTIKDDLSIDCDDQGAYYITTRIKSHLFEFLEHPEIHLINRFLPLEGTSATNIQVNLFKCGGIAIGVCISHRILDGTALSMFLKGWATAAFASSKEVVYPDFSASSLFPAKDLRLKNGSMAMWGAVFKKGEFITKRFVFDGLAIAKLKEMATTSSSVRHPTRVEAISAFIWKYSMAASEEKRGSKKPSSITHIVNLRKRAVPNYSEHSIGNLIWMASAKCNSVKNNETIGLPSLVHQLTKSISKIDADYVKKLRSTEASLMMYKHFKEIGEFVSNGSADCFGFTSWCKLGFYDADFGWGKPVWVSSMDSSIPFFMNLIVLMDTRCGTGIEAWITLDEQEMSILENNQEFQAFTLSNPSPLNIGHASTKFSR